MSSLFGNSANLTADQQSKKQSLCDEISEAFSISAPGGGRASGFNDDSSDSVESKQEYFMVNAFVLEKAVDFGVDPRLHMLLSKVAHENELMEELRKPLDATWKENVSSEEKQRRQDLRDEYLIVAPPEDKEEGEEEDDEEEDDDDENDAVKAARDSFGHFESRKKILACYEGMCSAVTCRAEGWAEQQAKLKRSRKEALETLTRNALETEEEAHSRLSVELVSMEGNQSSQPLAFTIMQRLVDMLKSPKAGTSSTSLEQYWGELLLIRKYQQTCLENFLIAMKYTSAKGMNLTFNSQKCHENISIMDGDMKVIHRAEKKWSTVFASNEIEPHTGVHEWTFILGKCDKGHIFAGIATCDAPLDSYVGCDGNGWGLIGTKALWHSKNKVNSEYGDGFATGDELLMRYDSDNGTLSYVVNGKDYGIAFTDLPTVDLFPTLSVFQQNDYVTIKRNQIQDSPGSADGNGIGIEGEQSSAFITYLQTLCSHTNEMLSIAQEPSCDADTRERICSHPFISILIPSIMAALYASTLNTDGEIQTSLQIFPYLTVLARALADISDLCSSKAEHTEKGLSIFSEGVNVLGNICGNFQITTCGANTNSEKSKVNICFDYGKIAQDNESESGDDGPNCSGYNITGNGIKYTGSILSSRGEVKGAQQGTEFKFMENWDDEITYQVRGHISLDGCHFSAKQTRLTGGTNSSVVAILGTRNYDEKNFVNSIPMKSSNDVINSILCKSALLCVMACGKLASSLIMGLRTFKTGDYSLIAPMEDDKNASNENNDTDKSDDEGGNADNDNDNDNGNDPSLGNLTLDITEESQNQVLFSAATIQKWVQSELFSGGLPLDDKFIDTLRHEIISICTQRTDEKIENIENIGKQLQRRPLNECESWWLSETFPVLFAPSTSASTSTSTSTKDEPASPVPVTIDGDSDIGINNTFITEDGLAKDNGLKLDAYATHHTGLRMITKVGGEPMQLAKRLILAALIKHGGCNSVCEAEIDALSKNKKLDSDRPSPPIVEVWNAAKKVLQNVLKKKQESGLSYANVSEGICTKASFLLEVQLSKKSQEIFENLSFIGYTDSEDKWQTASAIAIQQESSKIISECVDFLLSSIRDPEVLKLEMAQNSLTALTRSAGFNSVNLLFARSKGLDEKNGIFKGSPMKSIMLQPAVLIQVSNCISKLAGPAMETDSGGHYEDLLHGIDGVLLADVKVSFEKVYEHIVQLLSRCSWANNRDGQCVALSAWTNVNVGAGDHAFLNRIGIFRVLQTVLDGARSSITSMAHCTKEKSPSFCAYEMTQTTNKRLSQLALQVIYSLASQVAFSKEVTPVYASMVPPRGLQRIQSGPDTLSQSLFDLLYNELYIGMRDMLKQHNKDHSLENDSENAEISDEAKKGIAKEKKESEKYMFQILRLLYIVSNSKICLKSISTPKWLTLLISGIGYGEFGIQRRLVRLLRRILVNLNPDLMVAYNPGLFCDRDFSDTPIDDDDVLALISEQNANSGSEQEQEQKLEVASCAERLVFTFLEGIGAMIPSSQSEDKRKNSKLFNYVNKTHNSRLLSAESLNVLRELQGVPAWRDVIAAVLHNSVKTYVDSPAVVTRDWSDIKGSISCMAALGVVGGYFDYFHLGGMVYIKPFSLVDPNSTFASKQASTSHHSGMIVSQSNNKIEVIELERGIRFMKQEGATDDDLENKVMQQTACLTSNLPIRSINLSRNDVLPATDVQLYSVLVPSQIFDDVIGLVKNKAVPWWKRATALKYENDLSREEREEGQDDVIYGTYESGAGGEGINTDEEIMSDAEVIDVLVNVSAFRSCSKLLNSSKAAGSLISSSSPFFVDMLQLAVSKTDCGGLAVIEQVEIHWNALWNAYCATTSTSKPPAEDTANTDNSDNSESVINAEGAGAQPSRLIDNAATRNIILEAAAAVGIFSPFGNNRQQAPQVDQATQTAAVAQMVDMGLPPEWCEVALRRCLYNVELAINMCFEHGDSMSQMVAEDAMLQANQQRAQQALAQAPLAGAGVGAGSSGNLRRRNTPLLTNAARRAAPGGTGGSAPSNVRNAQHSLNVLTIEVAGLARQLEDMGFPQSWCIRALNATNNNLDNALGYILTNSDELNEEDNRAVIAREEEKQVKANKADDVQIVNPLVCVVGQCKIGSDLSVSNRGGGFPSVGCRGFGVTSGKWYYETTLKTAGCIQLGWADSAFQVIDSGNGEGVGDCNHSWAYDGWRMYSWNELYTEWGARWVKGDVVGCMIDMDERTMSFTLNGLGEEIDMGVAFTDFKCSGTMYPCASFNRKEEFTFNFGSTPFKHGPPLGYNAYVNHVHAELEDIKAVRKQLAEIINSGSTSEYNNNNNNNNNEDAANVEEARSDENNNDNTASAFDDSFETRGDHHWQNRYQLSDSTSAQPAPKYPAATLPDIVAGNRSQILRAFVDVSRDLCTLYSRESALKVLESLPEHKDDQQIVKRFVDVVLNHSIFTKSESRDFTEGINAYPLQDLMKLVKMHAVNNSRTQLYWMTMALMPPQSPPPRNLGSKYSVGSGPMLNSFRDSFAAILSASRSVGHDSVVRIIMGRICAEVNSSADSKFSHRWGTCDGLFAPVFTIDNSSDENTYSSPSLIFAVWMTKLLTEQFSRELSDSVNDFHYSPDQIVMWMEQLVKHWSSVLRARSLPVKVCGTQMLSILLQSVSSSNGTSSNGSMCR